MNQRMDFETYDHLLNLVMSYINKQDTCMKAKDSVPRRDFL